MPAAATVGETNQSGGQNSIFTAIMDQNSVLTPTVDQNPIFSGNPSGETMITASQAVNPIVNAINQENILPKVDDGKGPLVVININAENADIDGDINKNPNVETNVNGDTQDIIPEIQPIPESQPTDNTINLRYLTKVKPNISCL